MAAVEQHAGFLLEDAVSGNVFPGRRVGGVDRGVPESEAVVLDVSQLQTLLRKSFDIGIDPDPRKPRALNRLELAKAPQGAAEANALAAKGIAIERDVESEQIAGSEALALHAAAYNGMPDPVFHLVERAIGIVTALAAVEPDPRAGKSDMLLDTALRAATALAQLLQARHGFTTAETPRPARRDNRCADQRQRAAAASRRGDRRLLPARGSELGSRTTRPRRSELERPRGDRSASPRDLGGRAPSASLQPGAFTWPSW